MPRTDFDVIVVGAGVGGAAAAYSLRRAGFQVLVVDKARLPRDKACGGAIPRPILERFPFSFESVIRAIPTEVRFTFPGLSSVDVALPDRPVIMVMRREFDLFLLNQADAEIWDNHPLTEVREADDYVRVTVGERTITARYLIGADGANSFVARSLGLWRGRRLGGSLEAEVPLTDPRLQAEYQSRAVFCLGAVPWGYLWIFPKGDALSVGIGQFRPRRVDLRSILHQEMSRLGIELERTILHGHPIPCYQAPSWPWWQVRPAEKLATRRCVLVGDAARLVDPLLGEGIRYAMTSGWLAAEAIARDNLSGYERNIWREIGHSLATAGRLANFFYHFPKLSFRLGVCNPATIRHFVGVLTERFSYQGSGRRLLAATIAWLLGRSKGRWNPPESIQSP